MIQLQLRAGAYVLAAFFTLGTVNLVTEAFTGEPLLHGGTPAQAAPQYTQDDKAPSPGGWTLPVRAKVTTLYGIPGTNWASGHHTGIDFAVPTGTKVHAAASGTVVTAGNGGAYGSQIVIRHDGGHYTQYAHLSEITVRAGQTVTTGMEIGRSGNTGNSTGPHLHFEIRTGPAYGSDISPVPFLHKQGVTL